MANTTADKLAKLNATKADLKAALAEKGQTVGEVFSAYPAAVRAISSGGVQTALEIDCHPGEDYITAVSPYDSFSTASFGSKFLECIVGDLVYITCKTLQDFYDCEEISIPYEGPNPNPNFGDSKLLKITGESPSVSAYY